MKHDILLISSNGKPKRKEFPLSALGNLISKHALVARTFIMSKPEWEDIVKWSKEEYEEPNH